ncbi:MAG: hypothetical protein Q7S17_07730 [Xanthobacteraceae bacterium]|nr:hypothetical protein [Xanthobacteraceae bacterium]
MTTDATNTTPAQPEAPKAEAPGEERARLWDEMAQKDNAAASAKAEPAPATPDVQLPGDKAAGVEEKAPVKTEAEKPAAIAPDIWAAATPEQRAALDRMNDTIKATNARNSHLQKQINASRKPAATSATGKDASTAAPATGAGPASERFKKAKSEYPEVMEPVDDRFSVLEENNRRLTETVQSFTAAQFRQHAAEQKVLVVGVHPDYDRVAQSPEFHAWYEQALPYQRVGVERNAREIVDGREVIALVKDFKADTGFGSTSAAPADTGKGDSATAAPDTRQRQLTSAASPRTKGPQAARGGLPAADDREGSWNHFAAKDREAAQRQG